MKTKNAIGRLQDAFETLLRARSGGYFVVGSDAIPAGRNSSMFVLVSFPENPKPRLVKIGWGEFGKDTFETDALPGFHQLPIALYVVRQNASYFVGDAVALQMEEDPTGYLKQHSVFVAFDGKVTMSERVDSSSDVLYDLKTDVIPMPYDEMMRVVRNHLIRVSGLSQYISDFFRLLPTDSVAASDFVRKLYQSSKHTCVSCEHSNVMLQADLEVQKKLALWYVLGMGINCHGAANGSAEVIKDLFALQQEFNPEKMLFA